MKRERAFTLLELMVVVAITSVLVTASVPVFVKFLKRSKTSEVYLNIRKMYDGEVAYFNQEHVLASGAAASRDFVATNCQPDKGDGKGPGIDKIQGNWDIGNWQLINFSTDGPTQFMYMVNTGSGVSTCSWNSPGYGADPTDFHPDFDKGLLARAFGDLDGDGSVSQFARGAYTTTATDEIMGISAVFVENELE